MSGCRYLYILMHATLWWCMCCIPWSHALMGFASLSVCLCCFAVSFPFCVDAAFSLSITYTCVCVCVAFWFGHHWLCDVGILVQLTSAIPLTLWLWQHLDHSTLTISYHVWFGQHPLKTGLRLHSTTSSSVDFGYNTEGVLWAAFFIIWLWPRRWISGSKTLQICPCCHQYTFPFGNIFEQPALVT